MKNFNNLHILVIGDVALNIAISGSVDRISPEAPVPVVLEASRKLTLGCAAGVADCVAALGARATLLGVIGDDDEAKDIVRLCKEKNITVGFVRDVARPTIRKTRIFARHRQLLRIDAEKIDILSAEIEKKLIAEIEAAKTPDFIIVSDYHKGTLTSAVMDALRGRFGADKIIADFKPANAPLLDNIFAITPNLKEAYELTGVLGVEDATAERIATMLAERHQSSVVFKRSEHGMTVLDKHSGVIRHIPSKALEVFDVTGAGDSVIAAVACMLASGSDLFEAAEFANRVAAIAVAKEGVATVTLEEVEHGRF